MANAALSFSFKVADTPGEFEQARNLFQQYADSLGVDLSFQNFSTELETIATQYYKPRGALLLAFCDNDAIGCAAIRELDKETAELKRMYVIDEYRQHKIGRRLLELSINLAAELQYQKIRLDTLPSMTQAQSLYRKFGFYEIEPYRFNPIEGTVYMEKKIESSN
ncbi:MAG: GNAT family N-acetyltransferase [Cyclobacteriaceae bacterium]